MTHHAHNHLATRTPQTQAEIDRVKAEAALRMTARGPVRNHEGHMVYLASGPDGHMDLIARDTEAIALRDGREYFLRTREFVNGSWRLRRD